MRMNHANPSKVWNHLLWKDLQQAKPVLTAILWGFFLIQLLLLSIAVGSHPSDRSSTLDVLCGLSVVAPIFAAVGCCGMLVGHERQSGSWAWSSSLPISWQQSLVSKVIITLLGCIGILLPLCVLPIVVISTGMHRYNDRTLIDAFTATQTVAVMFEVIVGFYLAALLFRDTLVAMVVAGIFTIVLQLMLIGIGTDASIRLNAYLWNSGNESGWLQPLIIALLSLFSIIVGSIAMLATYRWRWGFGQNSPIWNRISMEDLTRPRTRLNFETKPSEWQMHLSLALHSHFWLRVFIAVSTFLIAIWLTPAFPPTFILEFGAIFLGVTAFESDQSQGRYRFLSDRGVRTFSLTTSRLLVPVGMLVVLWFALFRLTGGGFETYDFLKEIGIGMSILVCVAIGALSSLCFRQAIVACLLAISTLMLGAVFYKTIGGLDGEYVKTEWLTINSMFFIPVTLAILVAAVYPLARKWIVADRANLALHYVGITVAAVTLPLFLSATFSYLAVPSVPWTSNSLDKTEPANESYPPLETLTGTLDAFELGVYGSMFDFQIRDLDSAAILGMNTQETASEKRKMAKFSFDDLEDGFAKLSNALIDFESMQLSENNCILDSRDISKLIRQLSYFGRLAIYHGKVDLARHIWGCCKRFQEWGGLRIWAESFDERVRFLEMLEDLDSNAIELLGGPPSVREFLPDDSRILGELRRLTVTQARNVLRGQAYEDPYHWLGLYHRPVSSIYPPIRWRMERELAIAATSSTSVDLPLSPGRKSYWVLRDRVGR